MRIWIVNHYLVPPSRGGNTRHHQLAKVLLSRGHRVLLVGASNHHLAFEPFKPRSESSSYYEIIENVECLWVKSPIRGVKLSARFLSMILFAVRGMRVLSNTPPFTPDVVVGSTPHPFGAFMAQRVAKRYAVPFVFEIRDLWPATLEQLGGFSSHNPILRLMSVMEANLLRRASLVVSVLGGIESYLRQQKLARPSVVYVPNIVDLALVENGELSLPPSGDRDSRFVVMYAGNHGLSNALDDILRAAMILKDSNLDDQICFRFVGQGAEKKRLKAMTSSLGLKNVCFEDPVPKPEIFKTLATADVLVATVKSAEIYRYGLSLNKVLDYLAVARPVVLGSDSPSNPVLVSGAGLAVPPENPKAMADAILKIRAMSVSERQKMGEKGREFVYQLHSKSDTALELELALKKVIRIHRGHVDGTA